MGYDKPLTGNEFQTLERGNYAATYRMNTLLIPHARIFNESSIALSSDHELIAAIVVPPGNHGNPEVHQVLHRS